MHGIDRRARPAAARVVRDPVVIPHHSSRVPHLAAAEDRPRHLGVLELTTLRMDLVKVSASGATLGYIELVGTRLVALAGSRYDRALEVGQFLLLQDAVDAVTTSRRRA